MRKVRSITTVFLLTSTVTCAAQNLVVNPGFEIYTGISPNEFPGWTDPTFNYFTGGNAHSGSNAAATGIVGQTAPLDQDIALGAGRYKLSFYAYVGGPANSTDRILQVSLGNKQLLNQVNPTTGSNAYQLYTFNYRQAVTGISRLEFDVQNDPSATYIDDVSLVLLRAFALTPNLIGLAQTQNQRAVASGLTAAFNSANLGTVTAPNGPVGALATALNNTNSATVPSVLNSLSGEGVAATQNLAHRSAQLFNDAIFDQTTFYGSGGIGNSVTLTAPQPGLFAYAPQVDAPRSPIHELADLPSRVAAPTMPTFAPTRTWRAWGSGFGGVDNIHGNGITGSASQNNDIYGGAIGVDYQLTPNYLVGVAVGGSDGQFSVPGRSTFGSTTGGHIAFYDIATFGSFYGASSTSFSYFTNRTTRNVAGFGGLGSETDRGNFDSHEFRTRLEFGRHFSGYGGTITPFVALELAELRSNGFTESAVSGPGLFALNVNGQSSASVPSFVGVRYQGAMTLGSGIVLSPSMEVAYVHEFAPQRTQIGTLVDLPGSTFLVDGARPSYNAAKVKVGGEIALTPRSFLFANFDGEFSGVDQFYGGKGGFKYVW